MRIHQTVLCEPAFEEALAKLRVRGDAKAARDTALLRLLHDLGLCRNATVGLDLDDVDLTDCTVAVAGWGRSEPERLTLPAVTVAAISAWLAYRGGEPGPLFTNFNPTGKGKRLTGAAVWYICEAFGFRPRWLRHTAQVGTIQKWKAAHDALRELGVNI